MIRGVYTRFVLRTEPFAWGLTAGVTALLLVGAAIYFGVSILTEPSESQYQRLETVGVWAIGILIPLATGVFAWKKLQWERRDRLQHLTKMARRVKATFNEPQDGVPLPEVWEVRVEPPPGVDLTDLAIGVLPTCDFRSHGSTFRFTSLQIAQRRFTHPHCKTSVANLTTKEEFKNYTKANRERVWVVFSIEGARFVRVDKQMFLLERAPWRMFWQALGVTHRAQSQKE